LIPMRVRPMVMKMPRAQAKRKQVVVNRIRIGYPPIKLVSKPSSVLFQPAAVLKSTSRERGGGGGGGRGSMRFSSYPSSSFPISPPFPSSSLAPLHNFKMAASGEALDHCGRTLIIFNHCHRRPFGVFSYAKHLLSSIVSAALSKISSKADVDVLILTNTPRLWRASDLPKLAPGHVKVVDLDEGGDMANVHFFIHRCGGAKFISRFDTLIFANDSIMVTNKNSFGSRVVRMLGLAKVLGMSGLTLSIGGSLTMRPTLHYQSFCLCFRDAGVSNFVRHFLERPNPPKNREEAIARYELTLSHRFLSPTQARRLDHVYHNNPTYAEMEKLAATHGFIKRQKAHHFLKSYASSRCDPTLLRQVNEYIAGGGFGGPRNFNRDPAATATIETLREEGEAEGTEEGGKAEGGGQSEEGGKAEGTEEGGKVEGSGGGDLGIVAELPLSLAIPRPSDFRGFMTMPAPHCISLSERGAGLCNLLFGLVSAILRAAKQGAPYLLVDDLISVDFQAARSKVDLGQVISDWQLFADAVHAITGVCVILRNREISHSARLRVRLDDHQFKVTSLDAVKIPHGLAFKIPPESVADPRRSEVHVTIDRHTTVIPLPADAHEGVLWKVDPLKFRFYMAWLTHWPIETFNALLRAMPLVVSSAAFESPHPNKPLSVFHCRNEPDSILHWSGQSRLSQAAFCDVLHRAYGDAILRHIPRDHHVLVLSYRVHDNPMLTFLRRHGYTFTIQHKAAGKGRELNALQDLTTAIESCSGVFVGNFSMERMRGSSFTYTILQKMRRPNIKCVLFDLDGLGNGIITPEIHYTQGASVISSPEVVEFSMETEAGAQGRGEQTV
jgi:hypothetical protein